MKKTNLIGLILVLATLPFISAQAYNCPMNGYGGMMYGAYGTNGLIAGWAISLLIIAALILFVIWMIKQIQK